MNTGRVEGKVAFITGAARGQGRSHAVRLAEEGADIVAVDLCEPIATVGYPMPTADDLAETVRLVEATGRRIIARPADVRDPDALADALGEGVDELGRLDVVVANAGIFSSSPAHEMSRETWSDVIDINLTGVWNTCQQSLPHLFARDEGGSIVLVSSSAGLRSAANIVHYSASKFGVRGIMHGLAVELAPRRIRVNSVHPTTVNTTMVVNDATFRLFRPDLDSPTLEDALALFDGVNMLDVPFIEPLDVSNAVLWLASDESRYVTSIALPIDAGASQRPSV